MKHRIQIISDLHQSERRSPVFTAQNILPETEFLVLDGDIFNSIYGYVDWLETLVEARPDVQFLVVMGNHEYYYGYLPESRETLFRQLKKLGPHIFPMENTEVRFPGIRFLGATLWSWVSILERLAVRDKISDYKYIYKHAGVSYENIRVEDTNALHLESKAWLENTLEKPFSGKTVVITHHVPLFELIHPKWLSETTNTAYASNLSGLICNNDIDLWIYGHSHDQSDKEFAGTRFINNAFGYGREVNRRQNALEFLVEI